MVSPSCSARSSSSFVQYIVLSSERKSSIPLLMQPLGVESKWRTRSKAIDTNIRGVIPFSLSSTQAALLICSARGDNRAHEFFTCFCVQGTWAVHVVVHDAVS